MVWEEISLKDLAFNLKLFKDFLASAPTSKKPKIMAVVKANAYGHGAEAISKKVLECGACCLGVAVIQEGIRLRKAGIDSPVLVLGQPCMEMVSLALAYELALSVTSYETARRISELALAEKKTAHVHIKIDTGMNRIGIPWELALQQIALIRKLRNLAIDGVFTHFSSASEKDPQYSLMQQERFQRIVQEAKSVLSERVLFHAANSAAFLRFPETHFDMVRLGILMYGLNPFSSGFKDFLGADACGVLERAKPILSLKARLSFVKKVPEGACISYCAAFQTKRESLIGTLPVGYADGYSRLLSNKASAIFRGQYVPLVGMITMDQSMVDLTEAAQDIDSCGEESLTLIGRDGDKQVSAGDLADLMGTIHYEVLCNIKERIPKIYRT